MTQDGRVRPFENLLVVCAPFGDNAPALSNAAFFAKHWDADLTALAVLEPPVELDTIFGATHVTEEAARSEPVEDFSHEHLQSGAAVQDVVDRMAAQAKDELLAAWEAAVPDLPARVEVRVGKPFVEIVRHVIEAGNDMVIKTADEIHGLRRYLFSSTDRHLLRKCPCPVWLWRPEAMPHAAPKLNSVMAAVDVNLAAASEPETLMGLNRRILQTAAKIAAAEGIPVTVLHVWGAPDEAMVRRWSGSLQIAGDYVTRVEANHRRDLERLVADMAGWAKEDLGTRVDFKPLLVRGIPRGTIPELIEARKADLLVMGTIARTGVPGFFIGNTAEDVLSGIDCSVVTVKPPDYVSPLEF